MSDKTGIEWTDATWNPTTGCDQVSPGCDNCYALTLAKRLKAMGSPRYQVDGNPATSGPGFGFTMHTDALGQPLRWKRPRRIFVNSMSDLFHTGMSVEFLAEVFAVMSMAPQHTFQVLTKRPGVMASVLSSPVFKLAVSAARLQRGVSVLPDSRRPDGTYAWPLSNVWVGTSVEDQKRADLRIPHLLRTPAAVRFLSMEPLLGPVDLWRYLEAEPASPDWIIAGGESGPGARPMHPDWVRSLRDQTRGRAAFHFKQWGAWAPWMTHPEGEPGPGDTFVNPDGDTGHVWFNEDLGYATNYAGSWGSQSHIVSRVGKKAAGRELDGRTWDEYPAGDR